MHKISTKVNLLAMINQIKQNIVNPLYLKYAKGTK